jgi:hypothetical protein
MSEHGFKFSFDVCQATVGSLRLPQGSGSMQKRQEHNCAEHNCAEHNIDLITSTLEITLIV